MQTTVGASLVCPGLTPSLCLLSPVKYGLLYVEASARLLTLLFYQCFTWKHIVTPFCKLTFINMVKHQSTLNWNTTKQDWQRLGSVIKLGVARQNFQKVAGVKRHERYVRYDRFERMRDLWKWEIFESERYERYESVREDINFRSNNCNAVLQQTGHHISRLIDTLCSYWEQIYLLKYLPTGSLQKTFEFPDGKSILYIWP